MDIEEREAIVFENTNSLSYSRAIARIDLDKLPKVLNEDQQRLISINIDKVLMHIDSFIAHKWQTIVLFGIFPQNNTWDGVLLRIPIHAKIKKVDDMFLYYYTHDENQLEPVIRMFRVDSKYIWNL